MSLRPGLCISFLLSVLTLAACSASMQSTLLQEATWESGRMCSTRYPLLQIERVEPDGRYFYRGRDGWTGQLPGFQECVSTERSKAVYGKVTPKESIRNAYLTQTQVTPPPNTRLTSGPPAAKDFKVDQSVIFYLERYKTGRPVSALFKWYKPDGTVVFQSDRSIRDGEGGSGGWSWYTERLPSTNVQQPGAWSLEVSFDGEVVGRYPFTVSP